MIVEVSSGARAELVIANDIEEARRHAVSWGLAYAMQAKGQEDIHRATLPLGCRSVVILTDGPPDLATAAVNKWAASGVSVFIHRLEGQIHGH